MVAEEEALLEDSAVEVVAVEEECAVAEAASIEGLLRMSSQLRLIPKLLRGLCAVVSSKRRSHFS